MRPTQLSILPLLVTLSTSSVSAQDGCSLCPFGENVGLPDRIIPGRERTCEESSFLNAPEDSEECIQFRKSASWCGCPSAPQECFLCEKGDSSPTPDLRSPLFPDTSCLDYEFLASQLSADECPSLQERAGSFDVSAFCSCEATEAPKVCELCPGGLLVNPTGNSVVPGYTCEQVDQGLLQFFSEQSLCIEFRQVLLANNLCECVGSTDYPTAAPTLDPTDSPTKGPKTKEPKPTDAPSLAQTPAPTSAPLLTSTSMPTSIEDSKQAEDTDAPVVSQTSPPTLSPTPANPASKGSTPTPAPTTSATTASTSTSTTSAPTRRSYKGSFSSVPSSTPIDTTQSKEKGKEKGSSKVSSSKSTKKETKKLGNKGIEKKLKVKNKSKGKGSSR